MDSAFEAKPISSYRQAFDERHLQREDPITRKHQTLILLLMTVELRFQTRSVSQKHRKMIPRHKKINLVTFSFCFYYFYNALCFSPKSQTTAVIYHNAALSNASFVRRTKTSQLSFKQNSLDLDTNQ